MSDYEIHVEVKHLDYDVEYAALSLGWKISRIEDDITVEKVERGYSGDQTCILTIHTETYSLAMAKLLRIAADLGDLITRKKIEEIRYDTR